MPPLLTIVIANYNYGRFLETAIRSVLSQSCRDFELIICDGGSTDNSVEIIKKYANGLSPNTIADSHQSQTNKISWWCSEPDKGQSDAFNKGFAHARGRFLTWLNADDVLLKGTIERLRKAVDQNPNCRWFACGCVHTDPDLNVIRCTRARPFSEYEVNHGMITVYSPSSFFSRDLLEQVGEINVAYRGIMDTDLWFRFYFGAHEKYRVIPGYAFGFRLHPESHTQGNKFADSALSDPQNPKHERARKENEMMFASLPKFLPMSRIGRFIRLRWTSVFVSRYDTLRKRGKKLNAAGLLDL